MLHQYLSHRPARLAAAEAARHLFVFRLPARCLRGPALSDMGPAAAAQLHGDPHTLEVPFGEKSKITLSDGTNVWLNSGSKLIYSNRFDKENRVVKLEGEGYFEVTRHEGIPFKVETPAYAVLVKGTKFNVSAYSGDPYVTTTLLEGKVELLHEKNIYKIVPGESMRLNVATGRLQKTKVDATHSTAWLKNQVEFERITLKELAMKLSRQYNVQIRIASEALGSKAFRISLRNRETIGEVMKALQEIMPVTIEYKEDNIYIKE